MRNVLCLAALCMIVAGCHDASKPPRQYAVLGDDGLPHNLSFHNGDVAAPELPAGLTVYAKDADAWRHHENVRTTTIGRDIFLQTSALVFTRDDGAQVVCVTARTNTIVITESTATVACAPMPEGKL